MPTQTIKLLAIAAMLGIVACGTGDRRLAPIRLESILTVGATQGEGVMTTWPRVSPVLAGGVRILVPQPGGVSALPAVYDNAGKYLGTIGAEGDGPGEFRGAILARVGTGDSIYIFSENPRVVIFGPDRSYRRTVDLPIGIWDALVLADGRIVVTPPLNETPLPFVLLDAQGKLLREIGASDSGSRAIKSPRWVARGGDGTYWTMPNQFRWRLEHWDSTGALIGSTERAPDWFAAYDHVLALTHRQAPQATIQGFWLDSLGRVWVLGRTADPEWSRGLGAEPTGDDSAPSPILDADKVYDTVIELFDPASGKLLAAVRYDVAYPFVVEPGVVMRVLDTPDGWKRAELMRVVVNAQDAAGH